MAAKPESPGPKIPEILLNSGHKMPAIGLGCGASENPPMEELISVFLKAMEIGYRHFDTAVIYGTEEALGKAVAKALEIGLIQSRDELFITSKLWATDTHHDLVLPAIHKTLKTMGLEYLDLYLIHWPARVKQGTNPLELQESDALPFDMFGTWKAMEDCFKLGLAKSIGLSNFSRERISKLLESAIIPPAINQVEMNVGWQQIKLVTLCREKGIHVCAWSPLGAYSNYWGSNAVMESEVLKDIAAKKGKTVSQVALRWIYEQGATPIVKSFNEERMKQNLQIFDWELTKEENDQILQIPDQPRDGRGTIFTQKNGPTKSAQEVWDGDI